MKYFFTLCLMCLIQNTINGQETEMPKHNNFYTSLSFGPVFGNIDDELNAFSNNFIGAGTQLDYKAGFELTPNLSLQGTFVWNRINHPKIKGDTYNMKADMTAEEKILGGGFVYYIMPSNLFLSGTIGPGYYKRTDHNDLSNKLVTERGLSIQLKIGKEWWVRDNLAMGISLSYEKTKLKRFTYWGEEKLNSNMFGILCNVSFH